MEPCHELDKHWKVTPRPQILTESSNQRTETKVSICHSIEHDKHPGEKSIQLRSSEGIHRRTTPYHRIRTDANNKHKLRRETTRWITSRTEHSRTKISSRQRLIAHPKHRRTPKEIKLPSIAPRFDVMYWQHNAAQESIWTFHECEDTEFGTQSFSLRYVHWGVQLHKTDHRARWEKRRRSLFKAPKYDSQLVQGLD